MNIATYTRSLVEGSIRLHVASLNRVKASAAADANNALKRADNAALEVEAAQAAATAKYGDAVVMIQRKNNINTAVDAEIAALPRYGN